MEVTTTYFDKQFAKLHQQLVKEIDDRITEVMAFLSDKVVLKEDLAEFATKADLAEFAKKSDLEQFATKADLEKFATKEQMDQRFQEQSIKLEFIQLDIVEIRKEIKVLAKRTLEDDDALSREMI